MAYLEIIYNDHQWWSMIYNVLRSPKLTYLLKMGHPKRKGSSSNYQFSCANCWFQGEYNKIRHRPGMNTTSIKFEYINQYHILLHLWWLQRIFTKKWSIPDVEDTYIPTVVAFAFPWLQYLFTRPGSVFPRLSNWPPSHEATNSTSTSSRTAAWFFSSNTRRVFGCFLGRS